MDKKAINTILDRIKNSDPVADLAKHLLDAGVTEHEIWAAVKDRSADPIANELYSDFRSVARGCSTTNKYGIERRTE
jgi:hypothetical protein